MQRKDSVKWRKNVDKKEAIKELKFERNISAGVMEQLGTTKALREIVAIQQKKRTQTYDTAIEALEKQIPIKMKDMRAVNDFLGRYYTCIGTCPICGEENIYRNSNYCHKCGQALDWEEVNNNEL
jgi:hypothetical protein|nr:MAG TPA: PROTEIN/RNA Complex, archaeal, ribosomal, 50S, protein.0A [Caudoviricetes sp.]